MLVLPSLLLAGQDIGSEIKIRVSAEDAKVRFKASPDSPVVGTVAVGEIFTPEKTEGEWYRISFTNKEEKRHLIHSPLPLDVGALLTPMYNVLVFTC